MHLRNGEHFPTITASRVGGGEMTIPQDLAGRWTVLLFYRGHWCPYCRQQLLDFQRAKAQWDGCCSGLLEQRDWPPGCRRYHQLPEVFAENAVTNLRCVHFHITASCLRLSFLIAQRRSANHVRRI